jgi:hypothetical protein
VQVAVTRTVADHDAFPSKDASNASLADTPGKQYTDFRNAFQERFAS